ncbi:MAG: biotin transporter BioY [Treponema sp.]|nr:biotin transporter BioY [Treponema sp.]
MRNKKDRTRRVSIVLVALFAAVTAAGAFIAIPVGAVPIVLQNLFAMLSGLLLGPFLGGSAVLLYLAVGTIGAPVFAGGAGGFVHFIAPSGGFLYGYFLGAVVAGLIAGSPHTERKVRLWRIIVAAISGMLVIYIPGVIQLKIQSGMAWKAAFLAGCVPFLPLDAGKTVVAIIIAPRLRSMIGDVTH